ncbi:transcriptional regulator, TetR family [Pseudomonas synxantha]|uniref:Transcriptional regulator, TetR family n=1 Tax=Pseudomonas synxantha TaxID=47883 RepID=A0AAX3I9I1_9PSED|nr:MULTISPECIES: TetR/AcrR family transcriptional regulator [Pseudomonas]KRP53526.1 TetR family transcriptional regulator [Pseudomonas synxantha]NWB12301.1 TetR/AcrR family transcriptional regulator [Pseudomonas sp. D5002]SDU44332.1 transcriptional regulator, TetR family [Pseudomonas synxantha]VTR02330.1 transcriptional regulator, TetR family [Pseudomonas synxantha]
MTDKKPSSSRPPQQARGRERVSAILDACARLILLEGAAQVTMHGIAREAGTSIGSLYHFFSDKQRVLEALGERHIQSLAVITDELMAIDDSVWVDESAEGVIARLIVPILRYTEQHRDLVSLIFPLDGTYRLSNPDLRLRIEGIYARVLQIRLPDVTAEARQTYVLALIGLPMGAFQIAQENNALSRRILIEELPRALTAYLKALEGLHKVTG